MSSPGTSYVSGITVRSVVAAIACMLLSACYLNFHAVYLGVNATYAMQVLPPEALAVFLALVLISAPLYSIFRLRLLSREELLCILFALLIAVPLMGHGFWYGMVRVTTLPARSQALEHMDSIGDGLWPHGPNLLKGALHEDRARVVGAVSWETVECDGDSPVTAAVIRHTHPDEQSTLSMTVPAQREGHAGAVAGHPHQLGVLCRLDDPGEESLIHIRIFDGESDTYRIVASTGDANKKTHLSPGGFVRLGANGVTLPEGTENIRIELGFDGRGVATFADPKLLSVHAATAAFRGRTSPPRDEWVGPIASWATWLLLVLVAMFAVNVIMHRQWAVNERYPFPNARIPLSMLGEDEMSSDGLPRIWRNPYLLAGLLLAVLHGLLVVWHGYNAKVPDIQINVPLQVYFQDPGWGLMWRETYFSVSLFFLAIGLFFELNVLISLVIGYWCYRCTWWGGEATGWRTMPGYPWRSHQGAGAFLGYFMIVLFLSRRYLGQMFRYALKGTKKTNGQVLSYRTALLLLVASFAGAVIWAVWSGTAIGSAIICFSLMVATGFVATKFRAECGIVSYGFLLYIVPVVVGVLGGMNTFGPNGMMMAVLCSSIFASSILYYVPAAQLELIQYGGRFSLKPRHVLYTCILGVAGGLIIGGWSYLTMLYAEGADTLPGAGLTQSLNAYDSALREITQPLELSGTTPPAGVDRGGWALLVSGGITIAITLLRQLSPSFWFHPIGFILGTSHMLKMTWGSLFMAWVIRSIVLKFGGATSVRDKLQPFAVGLFAGALITIVLAHIIAGLIGPCPVSDVLGAPP